MKGIFGQYSEKCNGLQLILANARNEDPNTSIFYSLKTVPCNRVSISLKILNKENYPERRIK
jgi:hypothetical protein